MATLNNQRVNVLLVQINICAQLLNFPSPALAASSAALASHLAARFLGKRERSGKLTAPKIELKWNPTKEAGFSAFLLFFCEFNVISIFYI